MPKRDSKIGSTGRAAPPVVQEVLRSPGRPLDAPTREAMGWRLGHDFSAVRIHDDARAAQSAAEVGAVAYTVGPHVVFAESAFAPETHGGQGIIAHELTHVVQQRGATMPPVLEVSPPSNPAEGEAEGALRADHLSRLSVSHIQRVATVQRLLVTRATTGEPTVSPVDVTEYRDMLAQYRALLASGQVAPEDQTELEQSIRRAETAIREARSVSERGSTARGLAQGALTATGVLAADDITLIGIADDEAIPFTLIAAGVFGLVALAMAASALQRSEANRAAAEAVKEVISKIGQIVLAQQVGNKIRGLTHQIIIHLARILGTAVGGQPPDHQEDPEKDRPHWWKTEIKGWLKQIADLGLSPKQLLRELLKEFSPEVLEEIREAMRRAAELMGDDPPNFPPAVP